MSFRPIRPIGIMIFTVIIVQCFINTSPIFSNATESSTEKRGYDAFIQDVSTYLLDNPNDPKGYNERAYYYLMTGEYQKALSDYNKAVELDPDYANALYNRGMIYEMHLHDNDAALKDFTAAVSSDSNMIDAYLEMGKIYTRKSMYHKAIDCYGRFIIINPKEPEAYYNRAIVYYFTKDYDKSWSDIKKTKELGGEVYEGFIQRLSKTSGRNE